MTREELIEKGTRLFGKNFEEVANFIGHELTENVNNGNESLDILGELNENF